jgi:ABC-type phosphate/phosphonate transport system substrate-binding protein
LLIRADLRPDLKARIKQLLLRMHKDQTGRAVLKTYNGVTKFDEIHFDTEGAPALARQLYPLVAEELQQ